MKKTSLLLLSLLAVVFLHPAHAEWEPRGICHVWTGADTPEPPDDMLPGVFYDFNRDAEGKFFSYSHVYMKSGKRDLKYRLKARSTGANNPTNSPDHEGHFVYTLQQLIAGKYALLKRFYKYPVDVATPHIYMALANITSLEQELKGETESKPESDFIPDNAQEAEQEGRARINQKLISWIGVFRGRVIAPRDMTFRFYGAADDAMAVRFNKNLVLETGFYHPLLYKGNGAHDNTCQYSNRRKYQKKLAEGNYPNKKGYIVRQLKSTPYCNQVFSGITGGVPISVKKGQAYPIEIIIGNCGGYSLYYLLTQEVTPDNDAPLQLFRTNSAKPVSTSSFRQNNRGPRYENGPEYVEESDIWEIVSQTNKRKEKPSSKTRFRKIKIN